ncbi:MAG: hypothetical protein BGO78_16995 [Chloroflexi bacterium 44-23]|nr:MAG: hypothetical protein BGO78_16995 [Chloroflexi bacterium 44-23]
MLICNSTELKDICHFISGGTPSRKVPEYFSGTIPWITGADINENVITKARDYITEGAIRNSATKIVPQGSILLVTRTGVGKVAIAGTDICISQDLTGLELDYNKVINWYLFYFLLSQQSLLTDQQRGATIQGITRDIVENLCLPLPPLPEQQRIAAILQKADRLRRLRRYARQLSDGYLQSVFLEMFGDPATNSKGWKKGYIDDVISTSQYGTSTKSNNEQKGFPILGMANITFSGQLVLSSIAYVELSEDEFQSLKLEKGDIIFNRTNSTELVGKTALWDVDQEAVLASYLIKLKVNQKVTSNFLCALMNTQFYKRLFRDRCKKAIGQSNVSPTLLREFPVIIPPINLQKEFSDKVTLSKKLFRIQGESERQTEMLFQSLLQKAFQGEL